MSDSKRKTLDWIDGFMQYNENTEPPRSYLRWVAISVVASALQRKCRLEMGDLTFYPNMYIVLVGPPGKARKGTAMRPGREFLEDLGVPVSAEATTREALIRTLADSVSSVVDTKTGETEYHSSLTVYSAELVTFLGNQNYLLMSDLTDWFDCAPRWTYRTKTAGEDDIFGVWLNLIGATTPDLIRAALPLDAIGGGFASRVVFIYESNKYKAIPCPFKTSEELELRVKLLEDLHKIHALQGRFKVTADFLDKYVDWYYSADVNPPFTDSRFSGYVERRATHLLKLCMICSASRSDSMIISAQDFSRAKLFLTDAEKNMLRTFSGVGKSAHAATMEAVMGEIATRKETTMGELLGIFYQDVDQYMLENMIRTLDTMNFIDYHITKSATTNKIIYRGETRKGSVIMEASDI
jgi:hypothetical protein